MRDEEVKAALVKMEACIRAEPFETWRKAFVEKHIDEFSFDDENKLVYTSIHTEYEEEIEKRVIAAMSADFDLADFMDSLPAFLEGEGGKSEAIGKAATTLLQASDFQQFRDMMLFTKRSYMHPCYYLAHSAK